MNSIRVGFGFYWVRSALTGLGAFERRGAPDRLAGPYCQLAGSGGPRAEEGGGGQQG
jgi:hypothetical protein